MVTSKKGILALHLLVYVELIRVPPDQSPVYVLISFLTIEQVRSIQFFRWRVLQTYLSFEHPTSSPSPPLCLSFDITLS